jgi:DNA-binding NarL/FixJ family response regulator
MIRIVVVIERKQDRELIHSMLSVQQEFEIAGLGKDGYDVLKLVSECRPHIIIMDRRTGAVDSTELIPLIKRKSPATAIIILSGHEDDEYAGRTITAGASGYLVKKTDMPKLADSIRTVYNGGYFINAAIFIRVFGMVSEMNKYRDYFRNLRPGKVSLDKPLPSTVTHMELRIMACIGKGYHNKEIAACLSLKPGTVRNYISSIMRKAGLKNRSQIAVFALQNGLTETDESQGS